MFPLTCRVTVVGPSRRLDVVLPAALPVGELLPQLVALAGQLDGGVRGQPEDAPAPPPVPWRLSPVTGPDLAPHEGLREAGVQDGDVLLLRHPDAPYLGVLGAEDLHPPAGAGDAVAAVEVPPGRWTPGWRTGTALGVLGGVSLTLALALSAAPRPFLTLAGAVLAALVLAGIGPALAGPRPVVATALALTALPLWAGAGVAMSALATSTPATGATGGGAAVLLAGAGIGVAVGGVVVLLATPEARAAGIAVLAAGALTALAGAVGAVVGPAVAAGLVLAGAAASLPLLPGLASGLASRFAPAPRASSGDRSRPHRPSARIPGPSLLTPDGSYDDDLGTGHRELSWLLAALAPVLVGAGVVLAGSDSGLSRLLCLVGGILLLLRSRGLPLVSEVLPVALAGAGVLGSLVGTLALEAVAAGRPGRASAVVALALLAPLALTLPGSSGLDGRRARHLLRRVELVSLAALVPLVLGVVGLHRLVS